MPLMVLFFSLFIIACQTFVNVTPTHAIECQDHTISITSAGFIPDVLAIYRGDCVVFVNLDSISRDIYSHPHPNHSNYPYLNLGLIAPSRTRTVFLNDIDTLAYHSEQDPNNIGIIKVYARPSPSPFPSPSPVSSPSPIIIYVSPSPTPPATPIITPLPTPTPIEVIIIFPSPSPVPSSKGQIKGNTDIASPPPSVAPSPSSIASASGETIPVQTITTPPPSKNPILSTYLPIGGSALIGIVVLAVIVKKVILPKLKKNPPIDPNSPPTQQPKEKPESAENQEKAELESDWKTIEKANQESIQKIEEQVKKAESSLENWIEETNQPTT